VAVVVVDELPLATLIGTLALATIEGEDVSCRFTPKVKLPDAVGTPLTTPFELSASPGGRLDVALQTYG
jgi:hypothetical protein